MTESKQFLGALYRLAAIAKVRHAKSYHFDREGYPIDTHVCDKWEDRHYVNEQGINCFEYRGQLNDSRACTCGADVDNAEVERLKEELQDLTK